MDFRECEILLFGTASTIDGKSSRSDGSDQVPVRCNAGARKKVAGRRVLKSGFVNGDHDKEEERKDCSAKAIIVVVIQAR